MSTEKQEWQWLRPEDVPHHITSDPHEMLGKYMTGRILRTWTEKFIDEDTGEEVPIERSEVVMEYKDEPLNRDDISQLTFYLQSGDIKGIDVADVPIHFIKPNKSYSYPPFSVQFMSGLDKFTYYCYASDLNDAIKICMDFGVMYRHVADFTPLKVSMISTDLVQDTDPCIPESEQIENPMTPDKTYYKVTARLTYIEGTKVKTNDREFIINAADVGEAKTRMARYVRELWKDMLEGVENKNNSYTIRKAAPITADAVVPLKFSALYYPDLKERLNGKKESHQAIM